MSGIINKYKPGKLHLKPKKKSAALRKEEALKKQKEDEKEQLSKEDSDDDDDIIDSLTEAEAKFLVVNNKFKKRVVENSASLSYQGQIAKLNKDLQKAPMHNDLEGD